MVSVVGATTVVPELIVKFVAAALLENVLVPEPINCRDAKSVTVVVIVPAIVWAVVELKYTVPFESVNAPLLV